MQTFDRRTFLSGTARAAAGAAALAVAGELVSSCSSGRGASPRSTSSTRAAVRNDRGTITTCAAPGVVAASDLVDRGTLFEWVERMVGFGPRFTGSRPHDLYLDFLQEQLESYGLVVTRSPAPLERWIAKRWSLRVVDARGGHHTIPVAYYRPHSGETPPDGITAEVVDVRGGTAADYGHADVRGAIVLADLAIAPLTAAVWSSLADYMPAGLAASLADEPYRRVWLGIPAAPDLADAKARGAVAMINVLDMSSTLANGQYTPHQQVRAGLPTLHLDRVQGARVRSLMSMGPLTATLVLDAERSTTTVDYLTAELRGSGQVDRGVLLMTHTDGQNAIEENGGPALLALAEHLTRYSASCRPRDVRFVFSPNHMTSPVSTLKPDDWLRQHPEILNRLAMALVPEHLGTMSWEDDPVTGRYGPSGRSELAAIPVGNSATLQRLAIAEVKASKLPRAAVVRPREGGLYGEGTFPYKVGLPTIAYISGPSYLIQVTPGDNLDKLDRTLMHSQTVFLARVLSRMLALG